MEKKRGGEGPRGEWTSKLDDVPPALRSSGLREAPTPQKNKAPPPPGLTAQELYSRLFYYSFQTTPKMQRRSFICQDVIKTCSVLVGRVMFVGEP